MNDSTKQLSQRMRKTAVYHQIGKRCGFILAELLISLAILGVIATFTIPKILSSQQNNAKVALAKEVAAMISAAYQKAQADGIVNANTRAAHLTPYFNYLALDTTSVIDSAPTGSTSTCSVVTPCLKLHNGGMIWFASGYFSSTSDLAAIDFRFDPDPVNNTTSTADGPLKAVQFTLNYNGFITSRGRVKAGTFNNGGVYPLGSNIDPSWFSWN